MGRIDAICRYPVKSMGGESLSSVGVTERGLPGDRVWAVRDEVRGGIRGAKKIPALMTCSARFEKNPADSGSSTAEIRLPDGSVVSTSDADVNQRISNAIEHEVTLWPLLPEDAREHYARGAPDNEDMMEEFRAMFARLPDEPLPDLSKFPPELFEFESPPGTYFDCYPLLIMSRQSMEEMNRRAPDSNFDVRRFRPNLVVDIPEIDAPFPEATLEGKRFRIGNTVLDATVACPRCVMTTHGFEDLPKDPGIMRALVKNAEGNLGLYAQVGEPGDLAVGDSIEIID